MDIRELANDECVQGYRDGFDLDCPEPSANRTHAYRHGFECGRADRNGKPAFGDYHAAVAAYAEAVAKDADALPPPPSR